MSRTNEDWAQAIEAHVAQVNKLTSKPIASSILLPDSSFAQFIDHTLLKSNATPSQIDQLCNEAIKYKFKSCCVNGVNIAQVAQRLQDSASVPCAVVGFPLGASKSCIKASETKEAIQDGAQEIDMVINIGALQSGNYILVYEDIQEVVAAASGVIVKVILETIFLTDAEKIAACFLAAEAGAAFVKTSTGFCGGGATVEDVSLMRRSVAYKAGSVKVKASAGIRSFDKCMDMIRAGADRLGTSSGASIMERSATGEGSY
ncbi:hypothetical protein PLEOSDRAFT_159742 [Pleurotus ostreatus PC15]|uniref:deoxyribose-phosphate aldolase n=1 Tax=Pleurotus ostreatus (strain PC15) TaxID=1137138 RepID=A0A067NRW0_PLEO1|nr:hypothetical protein PLEOSDRAFT_159742 [Pleurotus ostreatus PC15]